ncbi:MAG: TetR family transcriptional regulator C-terminal domain-containing protein [Syntrophotaleaceae bacterium]
MATKGDRTRERILAEASRLILCKGLTATTVHDLMAATGLRKGSLYFHFPNKQDICLEVLRQAGLQFMAFLDRTLSGDSPGGCLDHFFREALELHRQNRFIGGCLFGNTALEASDTDPEAAALVAGIFADWISRIQKVVESAQETGQVRSDLPARELAEFVVAAVEGGIMQARLIKDEKPMARCLDVLRTTLELRISSSA